MPGKHKPFAEGYGWTSRRSCSTSKWRGAGWGGIGGSSKIGEVYEALDYFSHGGIELGLPESPTGTWLADGFEPPKRPLSTAAIFWSGCSAIRAEYQTENGIWTAITRSCPCRMTWGILFFSLLTKFTTKTRKSYENPHLISEFRKHVLPSNASEKDAQVLLLAVWEQRRGRRRSQLYRAVRALHICLHSILSHL